MRMNLEFKLFPAIEGAIQGNNGEYYDGENVCIYSKIPGRKDFVTITLDKHIFSVINTLSKDSINKTRRSLKQAVNEAIKNNKWQGSFTLYLDKGAFSLAD